MIAAVCLAAVIAIGSFAACGEGNVDDNNGDDTNITDMVDSVHPAKAGYREWWLPEFEEALTDLL